MNYNSLHQVHEMSNKCRIYMNRERERGKIRMLSNASYMFDRSQVFYQLSVWGVKKPLPFLRSGIAWKHWCVEYVSSAISPFSALVKYFCSNFVLQCSGRLKCCDVTVLKPKLCKFFCAVRRLESLWINVSIWRMEINISR